jgi:hypothetical protein
MSPPCIDCARGPAGIAGHENLYAGTMSSMRLGFTCRACGWTWSRNYAGEGAFRWEVSATAEPRKAADIGWFIPGGPTQTFER